MAQTSTDACAQTIKLPYPFWPAGVSLNYRVWKILFLSLLILSTYFIPLLSSFYLHQHSVELCVFISDCKLLFCDCACTLCAGTRLTNTVSNSSCDTVSPSQMMELIRSTICMWTFWLWPLLGIRGEKSQISRTASLYNLKYNIQHWFLLREQFKIDIKMSNIPECLHQPLSTRIWNFFYCNVWLSFALLAVFHLLDRSFWKQSGLKQTHCNALITQRVGVLILICMTVGGKAYYLNLYLSGCCPQRCLGITSVITSHWLKASLTHTHTAFPYTF